jgi:hypothetical protein
MAAGDDHHLGCVVVGRVLAPSARVQEVAPHNAGSQLARLSRPADLGAKDFADLRL